MYRTVTVVMSEYNMSQETGVLCHYQDSVELERQLLEKAKSLDLSTGMQSPATNIDVDFTDSENLLKNMLHENSENMSREINEYDFFHCRFCK